MDGGTYVATHPGTESASINVLIVKARSDTCNVGNRIVKQ